MGVVEEAGGGGVASAARGDISLHGTGDVACSMAVEGSGGACSVVDAAGKVRLAVSDAPKSGGGARLEDSGAIS